MKTGISLNLWILTDDETLEMLITICDNLLSYGNKLIFYYIRNKYNLLKNLHYKQYELSTKLMFVCSYINFSNTKIFALLLKIEIRDWKLKKWIEKMLEYSYIFNN